MDYFISLFQKPLADTICGGLLLLGLLLIAALHLYWTAGGKWGIEYSIPVEGGIPVFRPTPGATFVIGFGALLLAVIIPGSLGYYADAQPAWLYKWTPWVTLAIFSLRALGDFRYVGLFKRIVGSTFSKMDTSYYTPFALLMAFCSLVVAV